MGRGEWSIGHATDVALLDEPPPRYCEATALSTSGARAPTNLRTVEGPAEAGALRIYGMNTKSLWPSEPVPVMFEIEPSRVTPPIELASAS